ncbi:MAG: cell division protein FtsA [Elusimicrobia bacterium]|jgi:cell division protein FtsA|nr:cell division protein FtsA [Elusimicrobiota bacterium]MBK7207466.1 cell division protein FtsA [Elusimicrobiota bacterium]MBK7544236.1 cell division protein FtsA [Elusimicrobiota bacterium]MBK7573758.1 cell division protein FtsA [Elusimicrobiota bacterium]MBK7689356.1 cell division protein FtsA [Elusimicrobiota bacterium]
MPKPDVITGLDIGSGQVVAVVAKLDPDTETPEAVGAARQACPGLKGGVVINIDETARSITRAVEAAEEMAGLTGATRGVLIGVRGGHIQTFNHHGAMNIARTDKEITLADRDQVVESTKAVPISPDREIVHVIPQDFILDRQSGVPNPVGMEATLLETDVHIVTASQSHLNNVWKAIARAGFDVEEPIYGLLAVGDAVVTAEEKGLGCLLIDVGGQTTGLAVYAEGSVRFTKELPIGSDAISHDLSHALRTSLLQAQKVKEKHGAASRPLAEGNIDEDIEYTSVDGRTPRHIKRSTLFDYIAPRVEEIFTLVSEELQRSNYADHVAGGGVVLTGGGAQLQGLSAAVEQILDLPVRLGLPQNLTGAPEILANPGYATALGVVTYRHLGDWSRSRRAVRRVGLGQKLRGLVEDLF